MTLTMLIFSKTTLPFSYIHLPFCHYYDDDQIFCFAASTQVHLFGLQQLDRAVMGRCRTFSQSSNFCLFQRRGGRVGNHNCSSKTKRPLLRWVFSTVLSYVAHSTQRLLHLFAERVHGRFTGFKL